MKFSNKIEIKKPVIEEDKYEEIGKLYEKLEQVDPELASALYEIDTATMQIVVDRNVNKAYGRSFATIGLQGNLFQIIHKISRLKGLVVNVDDDFSMTGKQMSDTSFDKEGNLIDNGVAAHLMDAINYCRLALSYMVMRYIK